MSGQRFTNHSNGQLVGSIMALQVLVAQLIARHPDAEKIAASIDNMADNMAGGSGAGADFTNNIAEGIEDTAAMVKQYVTAISAKLQG